MFITLSYNHTCKLEFFIFFFRWEMNVKKIFPNGHPYKIYEVPTLTPPFLFCDINADKVH